MEGGRLLRLVGVERKGRIETKLYKAVFVTRLQITGLQNITSNRIYRKQLFSCPCGQDLRLKVTPDQPDTDCVQSTHTPPSPGAQHAPQHNVKFHTAELPGLAAAGTHAWRDCRSPRREEVGGGQIATITLIRTGNKQQENQCGGSVSHKDGKRKGKISRVNSTHSSYSS